MIYSQKGVLTLSYKLQKVKLNQTVFLSRTMKTVFSL